MAKAKEKDVARIREIAAEVAQLGPLLVGTLTQRPNRKRRRDGSEYVSAAYSTFQYKGADGRRKWKRIPRGMEGRVQQLIAVGLRYQALEQEYRGLASALGLLAAAQKKG